MNDFNKPIRPISKEDQDKIKQETIIQNFNKQQEFNISFNNKSNKKEFIAAYLELLRNFFSTFLEEEAPISNFLKEGSLLSSLLILKKCFEKIRDENPSHELLFAEQFSKAWQALLETKNRASLNEKTTILLGDLIKDLNFFSPTGTHSLGFYLRKYSEKEWFPAPFFDLLHYLHEEYWKVKKSSRLNIWLHLIEEILSKTKSS